MLMSFIQRALRVENLEEQLEELENKILKSKSFTRFDLKELEGLSNEIMYQHMKSAKILKED